MDDKQFTGLVTALALVRDRETYLHEELQKRAGDLLAEQDRLRKMRQALIGTADQDGLIQVFGPVLHEETGAKTLADGALSIVTGTEVAWDDEAALVAKLAQQGRYGYLRLRKKETDAMLRAVLSYEPDLPAHIETGPKVNGIATIDCAKGFVVPDGVQFVASDIEAQIERAQTERTRLEQTKAAANGTDLLARLDGTQAKLLDLLARGSGEDSPEYEEALKLVSSVPPVDSTEKLIASLPSDEDGMVDTHALVEAAKAARKARQESAESDEPLPF